MLSFSVLFCLIVYSIDLNLLFMDGLIMFNLIIYLDLKNVCYCFPTVFIRSLVCSFCFPNGRPFFRQLLR